MSLSSPRENDEISKPPFFLSFPCSPASEQPIKIRKGMSLKILKVSKVEKQYISKVHRRSEMKNG